MQLLLVVCCILLVTNFSIFSTLVLFLISILILCCCFVYINLWAVVIIFLFIEVHLIYMFTCLVLTWLSYENSSILTLMRSNTLNTFLVLVLTILLGTTTLMYNLKLYTPLNVDLFSFFCYDSFINVYIAHNVYSIFQLIYFTFFYTISFDFCIVNILLLLAVFILSSLFLFIQIINLYSTNKNFFFFKHIKLLPTELFSRRQEMATQLRRSPVTRVYTAAKGLFCNTTQRRSYK